MNTQSPGVGTRAERALAPGMLAVRDRLAAMIRRRPLIADAALAAVVLVVSVPPFTSLPRSGKGLAVALILATVCPLAWRRRAPFLVLVIMAGPAIGQLITGQQVTDFLVFLIAFYTVVVCSPPLQVIAATALLEAGIVLGVVVLRGLSSGRGGEGHAVLEWALASGLVAMAGLLGYYVRTNRRARAAAVAERAERLEREREQQALLAASAERARIAREMHDIGAHNIAVMIALAEGAAYTTKQDADQAVDLMGQVSTTGRTALTEMRRLLGVLRQPAADGHAPQPSLAELDGGLVTFRAAGLDVEMTVAGQPFPLPPSAQLAVYRMVQEALTNTLKHAPGAVARVQLRYAVGEVGLEVTDDGAVDGGGAGSVGLGKAGLGGVGLGGVGLGGVGLGGVGLGGVGLGGAGAGSGHGIAGMRERAAVFGGQVSAGPRPGGGWAVRAVLQVAAGEAGAGEAGAGEADDGEAGADVTETECA